MRTKEQIKEQRDFMKAVCKKMDDNGYLYGFVAKSVGMSSARLSQYIACDRHLPAKFKDKLVAFLKLSPQEGPIK